MTDVSLDRQGAALLPRPTHYGDAVEAESAN